MAYPVSLADMFMDWARKNGGVAGVGDLTRFNQSHIEEAVNIMRERGCTVVVGDGSLRVILPTAPQP